jgi:hypothetical protein
MKFRGIAAAIVAIWLAPLPVHAQATDHGIEAGVRYWLSSGKVKRGHNAQGFAPAAGNPTSVLTYDNVDAHVLELHAKKALANGFYLRGNLGVGRGGHGTLTDEDFLSGQLKFSESTSSVRGSRLTYGTVDVGRDLWAFGEGRATVGLFAGYVHWNERADAYGASFPVNLLGFSPISSSVPVISNEATWRALRIGVNARLRVRERMRLTADFAFVPYADLKDEDSHFLRTAASDLGATPNIRMKGRGAGFQSDLELRHPLSEGWDVGVGIRYWWLRSSNGSRAAAGLSLPLTEFESKRFGLTASITRAW